MRLENNLEFSQKYNTPLFCMGWEADAEISLHPV
jgi:hypothetical protein